MLETTSTVAEHVPAKPGRTHEDFERIVQEFSGYVRAFLMSRLHDTNATEDVLQETWLAFWNVFNKNYDPRYGPKTWLMRIANGKLVDFWRRTRGLHGQRVMRRLSEMEDDNLFDVIDPYAYPPDVHLMGKEELDAALEVIDDNAYSNDPMLQRIFGSLALSVHYDLTNREIAEGSRFNANQVAMHIYYARNLLRSTGFAPQGREEPRKIKTPRKVTTSPGRSQHPSSPRALSQ